MDVESLYIDRSFRWKLQVLAPYAQNDCTHARVVLRCHPGLAWLVQSWLFFAFCPIHPARWHVLSEAAHPNASARSSTAFSQGLAARQTHRPGVCLRRAGRRNTLRSSEIPGRYKREADNPLAICRVLLPGQGGLALI